MIPVTQPWIGDTECELVLEAVETGWVSPAGEFVDTFETRFAEFVETKHAFATTSGTSALHLALVAAGVGEGDEVIVPDLTWISCANVVRFAGADPVFADVDAETLSLDPESVQDAISDRTAAIMPVHLYGHPARMDALTDIATEHDLMVIEDAAEAHGATHDGRPVGSIGELGCFSFYGNKLVTTGQGGMITTDDDELAERIRLYRRDGMSESRKYYHPVVGYNYRLSNVQAAIGVGQLERIDEIIAGKRRVAAAYVDALSDAPVSLLREPDWGESVFWMNTAIFDSVETKESVVEALETEDVETRPLFYPLHMQPPYTDARSTECPVAESVHDCGINLPSDPRLDETTVHEIADTVRTAIE